MRNILDIPHFSTIVNSKTYDNIKNSKDDGTIRDFILTDEKIEFKLRSKMVSGYVGLSNPSYYQTSGYMEQELVHNKQMDDFAQKVKGEYGFKQTNTDDIISAYVKHRSEEALISKVKFFKKMKDIYLNDTKNNQELISSLENDLKQTPLHMVEKRNTIINQLTDLYKDVGDYNKKIFSLEENILKAQQHSCEKVRPIITQKTAMYYWKLIY
jgi:hypothetical protein